MKLELNAIKAPNNTDHSIVNVLGFISIIWSPKGCDLHLMSMNVCSNKGSVGCVLRTEWVNIANQDGAWDAPYIAYIKWRSHSSKALALGKDVSENI